MRKLSALGYGLGMLPAAAALVACGGGGDDDASAGPESVTVRPASASTAASAPADPASGATTNPVIINDC